MKKKIQRTYKMIAAENYGVYKKGELIRTITTKDLEATKAELPSGYSYGKVIFEEIDNGGTK
jgi:hypothetical protein